MPDQVMAQVRSTRGETFDLALPNMCTVGDLRCFLIEQYQYHPNTKLLFNGLVADDMSRVTDYPYGSLVIATPSNSSPTSHRNISTEPPQPSLRSPVKQRAPRQNNSSRTRQCAEVKTAEQVQSRAPPATNYAPTTGSQLCDSVQQQQKSPPGSNQGSYQKAPQSTPSSGSSLQPARAAHLSSVAAELPPPASPTSTGPQPLQEEPSKATLRKSPVFVDNPTSSSKMCLQGQGRVSSRGSQNELGGSRAQSPGQTPRGEETASCRDTDTPGRESATPAAAPWQKTTFTVRCIVTGTSDEVSVRIEGDASVADLMERIVETLPSLASGTGIVYRGKLLAPTAENRLFNVGIRGDCDVFVASGEYANPEAVILFEIEQEVRSIEAALQNCVTESVRKGLYENLMNALLRTDGLQSLDGVWRQRRKDTVSSITRLQDQLAVST